MAGIYATVTCVSPPTTAIRGPKKPLMVSPCHTTAVQALSRASAGISNSLRGGVEKAGRIVLVVSKKEGPSEGAVLGEVRSAEVAGALIYLSGYISKLIEEYEQRRYTIDIREIMIEGSTGTSMLVGHKLKSSDRSIVPAMQDMERRTRQISSQ